MSQNENPVFATFDELLESENFGATSRGTGTLLFRDGCWFIATYHCSFPIPNEIAQVVTKSIQKIEMNSKLMQDTARSEQFCAELLAEVGTLLVLH